MFIVFLFSFIFADYGGGYAGSEFSYASNARDLALSKSNLANGSNGYYQFSNPAILSSLKYFDISSSLMFLPLNRSIQTLSINRPLPPYAGIGFSLYRSATDGIEGRDLMNQFTREYHVSNYMGMVSFGLAPIEKLSIGLNLKTFFIRFVENHKANGVGIDLGLLLKILDNLTFALKAENLSTKINWKIELTDNHQSVENIPKNIAFGTFYQYSNIQFYFQQDVFEVNNDKYYYRTRLGIEYLMHPLTIQFGLNQKRGELQNEEIPDFNFVPTGGFGVNFLEKSKLPLQLNYAFETGRAQEGVSHMFTINFKINEKN